MNYIKSSQFLGIKYSDFYLMRKAGIIPPGEIQVPGKLDKYSLTQLAAIAKQLVARVEIPPQIIPVPKLYCFLKSAYFLGMSFSQLETLVKKGVIPGPSRINGISKKLHYNEDDLLSFVPLIHAHFEEEYSKKAALTEQAAIKRKEDNKIWILNQRAKKISEGNCGWCGCWAKGLIVDGKQRNYCWDHHVLLAWYAKNGSTIGGEVLADKFMLQGGRCFYTGEPLEVGKNATVINWYPKNQNVKNDISNLIWVTKSIRMHKTRKTPEQFAEFVKSIKEKK